MPLCQVCFSLTPNINVADKEAGLCSAAVPVTRHSGMFLVGQNRLERFCRRHYEFFIPGSSGCVSYASNILCWRLFATPIRDTLFSLFNKDANEDFSPVRS